MTVVACPELALCQKRLLQLLSGMTSSLTSGARDAAEAVCVINVSYRGYSTDIRIEVADGAGQ